MLSAYDEVLYVSVATDELDHRRLNLTTLPGWEYFKYELVNKTTMVFDVEGNPAAHSCDDGAPDSIKNLVPADVFGTPDAIDPKIVTDEGLFLGPQHIPDTEMYIASLTVPVWNNTTIAKETRKKLGYITVVFDISDIMSVANDTKGLGETGQVMILGPANRFNRMDNSSGVFDYKATNAFKVLLPPKVNPELGLTQQNISDYPILKTLWRTTAPQNGVDMNTRNVYGKKVAVG